MIYSKGFSLFFFVFLIAQTANAAWTKVDSKTLSWLQAINFSDSDNGFIGGTNGTFLITKDGGENWQQADKFTNDTINRIFFTDTKNGWILCQRDAYALGTNAPSYLLKTTDGGKTFSRVEFETSKREKIADIFFSKYGIGFAVGESGTIFSTQEDHTIWKKQTAPTRYLLGAGVFQSETKAVIVGGGGNIFFSEDSGYSWNNSALNDAPKSRFNSVFFLNDKTGWTVGKDGKIFQTINGGKTWRAQNSPVSSDLNDIAFLDTREGYAVGDNGTLLFSNTAGNIWTEIDSKTTHNLEKIYFNGKIGWTVGYGGTILKYQKDDHKEKSRPQLRNR